MTMHTLKAGQIFEHARQIDVTWKPKPGQKYADGPKEVMIISAVRRGVVYYKVIGATKGQFVADQDKMNEGGDIVGRWLT